MFSIKEVCQLAGVTKKTLFHYDKIGLLKPTSRKGKQGVKMYDSDAIVKLLEIRLYRYIGISIEEIRTILEKGCIARQAILNRYSEIIQREISCLMQKKDIVDALMALNVNSLHEILLNSNNIEQLKECILSHNKGESSK